MTQFRATRKRLERYALAGAQYRHWYHHSRACLRRVCASNGWDYSRFVQVLAVTSPRLQVARNVRVAKEYMRTGTLPPDVMRATRAAMEHWEETGEIRGAKTKRFARVLLGDDETVVVDSWMARALKVPGKKARNRAVQDVAERACQSISRRHPSIFRWTGLAGVQAAVWAGVILGHYGNGTVPMMGTTVDEVVPF